MAVVALAVLSAVAPPLYETGPVGLGVVLIPIGALLVVAWLVRLGQWAWAVRGPARPAELTLTLGRIGQAPPRGAAVRAAGPPPRGYAVWAVLRARGTRRHQRVVWEPWLRELTGPQRVLVRRRAGVTVVEVEGRGRLWPASFTLRRRPRGVSLTPLGEPATGRDLSGWRLLGAVALVATLPAVPHLVRGELAAGVWALAYVVALTFTLGQWFGVKPPVWRRGPRPQASKQPVPEQQARTQQAPGQQARTQQAPKKPAAPRGRPGRR